MSELYCQIEGSGEPLILLHGLLGSGRNLNALARYFSSSYRVFSVDLRNHGRSFHADECNYEVMSQDIERLIQKHALDSVSLIGHSMGGKVAMVNALKSGEAIRSLVVLDIAPVCYPLRLERVLEALLELDLALIQSRKDADLQLAKEFNNAGFRQFLLQNLVFDQGQFSWRLNLPVLLANMETLRNFPDPGDARFCGSSLFLAGADSEYVLPEHESVINQYFPNAAINHLANTGHWLHAENPDAVIREIEAFLQSPKLPYPSRWYQASPGDAEQIQCAPFGSGNKIMSANINKVVLAYSGGLDTSVILKWLNETYDCEVVTFTADIGQGEEVEPARNKAEALGVREIYIEDLTEEFVRDFVYPMFRANTIYEGEYLLGTSIARPLIAKRLIEIAAETGADAIAHGATGKGNDQVRFELGAYALNPDIHIIAPWREWDLNSREKLLSYAEKNQIPIEAKRTGGSPYSMDANLLHISYEGGPLEEPWNEPEDSMWRWTVAPEQAVDKSETLELEFKHGDVVAINSRPMSPAQVLAELNRIGGQHGIGRSDIVENRYVGIKSRGCYETPGGTILLKAHRAIESLTLDREVAHLKDDLMPRYANMIYNGYWWSPERIALQTLIDETQQTVNGCVRLKLYKGNVIVTGRKSETDSLFDADIATFEDDAGRYDQRDAEGFIKLNALRLRLNRQKNR